MTNLLETISNPEELRAYEISKLPQIARELRNFILSSVSSTGGHLSSNLGTVELAIALHYVFDTPYDRLIWDVGHQSYAHKVLTGRREAMSGLRQFGGISGFPKRSESEYDAFGTAHSSTSISAALGMAVAAKTKNEKRNIVAIIGDGAMSAGMAFEAMNNAGVNKKVPLIVILNDNEMSISPAVGALNRYLVKLISGSMYAATKRGIDKVLSVAPPIREFAKRLEGHAKGMVGPATIFEEFGFDYYGPIDGHNLDVLISTLENVKTLAQTEGPQFLHIITKKGKGYSLAELDPIAYHGPSAFDPIVGIEAKPVPKKAYTQVFGEWLCDMAQADERLIAITPAMREGSGLVDFERRFPDRYYDVGIAEQHAVTFAAGIACEGLKPVVAIYSTFLQRGYDQLIHDVTLQNLPIVFAIDRAGMVGADGATHAGVFDIAFLRCLPNLVLMTPSNEQECRAMLTTAFKHDGPTAVRYPRGAGIGLEAAGESLATLPIGKGFVVRSIDKALPPKKRIAFICFGPLLYTALSVAQEINATVVDMRFVKPLDDKLLIEIADSHDGLVFVEDSATKGGAGSACLEVLSDNNIHIQTLLLGLPDEYVEHGELNLLLDNYGLSKEKIKQRVLARFV
ncbi:1-deoxy-D-xylulose-5-phosphate synthase [Polynucleobacter wuianus]|uniref:1-deoxy-D-xylulose-5-phosphate synthase n=1 Tax=Polynucleobacter wuianus TaxID=1743168 RepID=A0A191UIH7_9BURK|nr:MULTISPECIES: 1-deoxy-D-xylulose-5-phosphate synthase [Polynucleobacter]ANJ00795.1 1-deoxy-D-xylulose-5-phosphate synthase [Polynucleobacter wuianus]MBU3553553.1 1-deoxy-D-xylulose-5-phosphate synthase [Polynucleobacter sp. MWH-Post4-6-1]